MVHIISIEGAEADAVIFEEPLRQTAHLPLRADVGSGAYNDVHTVFLRKAAKFGNVFVARKIKFALFHFVVIPKNVNAQCIHTQRLAHLDTVFPIFLWDARIMDFGGLYEKWLPVEQKSLVAGRKRAVLCGFATTAKQQRRNQ